MKIINKTFTLKTLIGLSTTVTSLLMLVSCGLSDSSTNDKVTNIFGITFKSDPTISLNEWKEIPITIATIQKLFNGINEENFKNITATWNVVETTKRNIMILRANNGFKFEELLINETLKSNEITIEILDITINKKPEPINSNEITGPITITTTQKLFNGINEENFNYLKVSWKRNNTNNEYQMVLIMKEGFILSENVVEIESLPFVVSQPPVNKVLTRSIVLANLKPGAIWDVLPNGSLTANDLRGYTEIGEGAFEDIQKIRPQHIFSVQIPNTVIKISKGAFENKRLILSNDIRFVTFEENSTLEIIDQFAFSKNGNLKEIKFPSSLKTIGSRAFQGCTRLASSFMLDSQLESIGDLAFQTNDKLSSLILPNGLKTIGYNAFSGCNGLEEIYIPISVTTIGSTPFLNTLFALITKISIPSIYKTRTDKLGLEESHWAIIQWI